MRSFAALVLLLSLFDRTTGNWFPSLKVKTVDELDIPKYLGRWFEIASSLIQKASFQRNSFCTFADYSLKPDGTTIKVVNSGRKNSATGEESSITGTAVVPDPKEPGRLIVSFPVAPKSTSPNYLVVKLGPKTFGKDGLYDYVIITTPYKLMTWVLARDVENFNKLYKEEVNQYLKENGYDYFFNRPRPTYQGNDCIYSKE